MISFSHRIMFRFALILCLVFIVTFSVKCIAQELKKSTGSSSIGASRTVVKNTKYSKALSYFQKMDIVESLAADELFKLFDSLNNEDQQELFSLLSNIQKRNLFQQLTDIDKQKIFQTLNDNAKIDLFNLINDEDRIVILSNLGRIEKSRLVNSLPQSEKQDWLDKYPELISDIDIPDEDISKEGLEQEKEGAGLSRLEKIFSGEISSEVDKKLHQFGYDFFNKEPSLIQKSSSSQTSSLRQKSSSSQNFSSSQTSYLNQKPSLSQTPSLSQKPPLSQDFSISQASPFTPERNIPVGPEYIIGPDDSFTIHLWGKVEETQFVTVSRDGSITLPRLGTLIIGGLTFTELKKFLNNKFKEYYPDFNMSITMDALKAIDIYMVGELNRPGTYNISSLSTVVSALSASGGPKL